MARNAVLLNRSYIIPRALSKKTRNAPSSRTAAAGMTPKTKSEGTYSRTEPSIRKPSETAAPSNDVPITAVSFHIICLHRARHETVVQSTLDACALSILSLPFCSCQWCKKVVSWRVSPRGVPAFQLFESFDRLKKILWRQCECESSPSL